MLSLMENKSRWNRSCYVLVFGVSRRPLKILNGIKLILDDQENPLDSYRISLASFRSFRGPLIRKPVTGHELFLAVSYSKPALITSISKDAVFSFNQPLSFKYQFHVTIYSLNEYFLSFFDDFFLFSIGFLIFKLFYVLTFPDGYSSYGRPEVRQLHERPLRLHGQLQHQHHRPHQHHLQLQRGRQQEPLHELTARNVTKVIWNKQQKLWK